MARTVIENIELVRVAKSIKQSVLADALGLTFQGYYHIAKGNTKLTVERLKIIATVLKEDVNIFFDDNLTDKVTSKSETEINQVQLVDIIEFLEENEVIDD